MQTRDQQYASSICKQVERVKGGVKATSYGSMAHTLPILIHTSGLAQALAFVASRAKDEGAQQLLQDLDEIVLKTSDSELLKQARESNLREYIYLTEQTLAALLWYKRYAQAILGIEASQEIEESSQERSRADGTQE